MQSVMLFAISAGTRPGDGDGAPQMPTGSAADPSQLTEMMFQMLDANMDNHLTQAEIGNAGETLGAGAPEVPGELLGQGFTMMDGDQDGRIDRTVR